MHKSSDLREAFQGYLDSDGAPNLNDNVEVGCKGLTVRQLVGKLRNCTDVLPAGYCEQLGILQGSTYAQAARIFPQFCEVG